MLILAHQYLNHLQESALLYTRVIVFLMVCEMESWSIDKARALYNIQAWSGGYFDITTNGHVCVVHTRWLAKANRLMWWIGLLFGKVESVSGTNKERSKILKLRTRI